VLRNSKWGPFLDYWRELLARHPDLPQLVEKNCCNISFEMYGACNAHLIAYEEPLAAALLFGVCPADATAIGPFEMETGGVPVAPLIGELRAGDDPVVRFQELRANIDEAIRTVNAEQVFRQQVRDAYSKIKSQGLSLAADKAAVMWLLSTEFPRDRMGHVFAAIANLSD